MVSSCWPLAKTLRDNYNASVFAETHALMSIVRLYPPEAAFYNGELKLGACRRSKRVGQHGQVTIGLSPLLLYLAFFSSFLSFGKITHYPLAFLRERHIS